MSDYNHSLGSHSCEVWVWELKRWFSPAPNLIISYKFMVITSNWHILHTLSLLHIVERHLGVLILLFPRFCRMYKCSINQCLNVFKSKCALWVARVMFILLRTASRGPTLKESELFKWGEAIKLSASVHVCLFVLMSICQYRPDNHGNTQGDFLPMFTEALRLYSEVNIWARRTTVTPCNTFITD